MRCPKCGYISFDHLETCNKCSKDLADVVEKFGGGLVRANAPQFLVMTPPNASASNVDSYQSEEQDFDEEFLDEDLNVLLADDEEDDDDSAMVSLSDDDSVESDLDGGIDFDFSFDDEEEVGESTLVLTEDDDSDSTLTFDDEPSLTVPTELSDMSDLAQKEPSDDGEELNFEFSLDDDADKLPKSTAGENAGGFDLEELNLELDSVLAEPGVPVEKEDFELSLNDIEFSEMAQTGGVPALNPDGSVDMDADLDFELDLGGLSLHKKEEKV